MTLKPYNAEQLDQLALRILDISHQIRQIGVAKRDSPQLEFALHEKKAIEWITHLEQWAADARGRLEMASLRHRGARLASRISD